MHAALPVPCGSFVVPALEAAFEAHPQGARLSCVGRDNPPNARVATADSVVVTFVSGFWRMKRWVLA